MVFLKLNKETDVITDNLGSKKLQQSDIIVQSLINLRDKLWDNKNILTDQETVLCYKINSCLYRDANNELR